MTLEFVCQICGEELEAAEDMVGQELRCPTCNSAVVVATNEPAGRLVQMSGPALAEAEVPLFLDRPNTIGKAADNAIVLVGETVSRRHCRVVWAGGGWQVEDLGSTNGTRVNGQRVNTTRLGPGDTLRVGAFTFRLEALASGSAVEEETPAEADGGPIPVGSADPSDALAALAAASAESPPDPKAPPGPAPLHPQVQETPVVTVPQVPTRRRWSRRKRIFVLAVVTAVVLLVAGWWMLPPYLVKRAALRYAPGSCFAIAYLNVAQLHQNLLASVPEETKELADLLGRLGTGPLARWQAELSRIRTAAVYLCDTGQPSPEVIVCLTGEFDRPMLEALMPVGHAGRSGEVLTPGPHGNGRYAIGQPPVAGWLILGAEAEDLPPDVLWISLCAEYDGVSSDRISLLGRGVADTLEIQLKQLDLTYPVWAAGVWPDKFVSGGGFRRIWAHVDPFGPRMSRLWMEFGEARPAQRLVDGFRRWGQTKQQRQFVKAVRVQASDKEVAFSAQLGPWSQQILASGIEHPPGAFWAEPKGKTRPTTTASSRMTTTRER